MGYDLPSHLLAMGKHEWGDLIARLRIPPQRMAVANALARFADTLTGTRVFPSAQKVADMANLHETNARTHIRALESLGLLWLVKRGGGRGGAPNEYRLTCPLDRSPLPLWLDVNFNRLPVEGPGADLYGSAVAGSMPTMEDWPEEHRALAVAQSVDNPKAIPVDNPETPSASGRHSGPPEEPTLNENDFHRAFGAPETEFHRALALPDLFNNPTHQPPAVLRNATTSLGETVDPVDNPESAVEEFETARSVLAALPDARRWRAVAEGQQFLVGGDVR